MIMIDGEYQYQ